MMDLVRQMRETLNLNDVLLIISIALFIPFRQAIPLAARSCVGASTIVSRLVIEMLGTAALD